YDIEPLACIRHASAILLQPNRLGSPPTGHRRAGVTSMLTRGWRYAAIGLCASIGVFLGLGLYTFWYAEGASYFSTDPRACMNCHIMREQFDSWQKSSHHAVAKCVDCHLPHDFIGKYLAKAENGFFHSKAFTLQDFPDPIRIKPRNARILTLNC